MLFVLPAGITPARSSLPGACGSAGGPPRFIAPPAEGVIWRATLRGRGRERLREIRVAVTDSASPDGDGWQSPARLAAAGARRLDRRTPTWILPADVQQQPLQTISQLR